MWVGCVGDSQTRSEPLKAPKSPRKTFSQISQKPWGVRVDLPKKTGFFWSPSLSCLLYGLKYSTRKYVLEIPILAAGRVVWQKGGWGGIKKSSGFH